MIKLMESYSLPVPDLCLKNHCSLIQQDDELDVFLSIYQQMSIGRISFYGCEVSTHKAMKLSVHQSMCKRNISSLGQELPPTLMVASEPAHRYSLLNEYLPSIKKSAVWEET